MMKKIIEIKADDKESLLDALNDLSIILQDTESENERDGIHSSHKEYGADFNYEIDIKESEEGDFKYEL